MTTYQTSGTLTGTIAPENVAKAMAYLQDDDMTRYIYPSELAVFIAHIEWHLHADGHNWHVTAKTMRELTDDELKQLSEWVSGQNSDGLGEGFEQQDFAEYFETDRWGDPKEDTYQMCSFDWEKNPCKFERVA